MEQIICIDFGSSYTKVAVRNDWNEETELLRDLGADETYSFCLPSTVACVEKNGRSTWLIGDDALSQLPGDNIRLYQNWKGKLFEEAGEDSDYESVATQFFQGLIRKLERDRPQLAKLPIRICIPRLKNEMLVEEQMLEVLEIAGITVSENKPCIFEPEANAYGLTTRGRNNAWKPTHTPNLEPSYHLMFEKNEGGLFDQLRKIAPRLDDFEYTILVVDIGSFTADFGGVTFVAPGGDIDQFKSPIVKQESDPIGISQLDEAVLGVLRRTARQAIKARPYGDWEDIKKRIYNKQEAAVRRQGGGMLVIGEDAEADAITERIDIYADTLVDACLAFCKRHNVRPATTVLTGGGALIGGLRERVIAALNKRLKTTICDLVDEEEPRRSLLEKPIPGGGWRHDEREVDARRRLNQDLVRGGSAIGGCSVAVDLPIPAPTGGAARVRW